MEWTVVTVIVALVGLGATVGAPIVKLNQNITKLNVTLDEIERRIKENEDDLEAQKKAAHDSHRRIWDHNDQQDAKLANHEQRITLLEHDNRDG